MNRMLIIRDDCCVGLVVKVPISRAADLGSVPSFTDDFFFQVKLYQ